MSSKSFVCTLPRLAYIGGVPVEPTHSGCALLYRLLQEYPADKLRILQPSAESNKPYLPGVKRQQFSLRGERWLNTRFHAWTHLWMMLRASTNTTQIRCLLEEFKPEAVLTVADGYAWLAAARFAQTVKVPLHLIVHDHWPKMTPIAKTFIPIVERKFRNLYRKAASRLCISPFMEEEYRQRYGISGQVLYPSWDKDHNTAHHPPMTYTKTTGSLVAAYAGSFYQGYPRLISRLAECLERRKGQLLLFGKYTQEDLAVWRLNRPNVIPQGFVRSECLISRLRQQVDFVFVPMSFERNGHEHNMLFSFPSKLTDYTATGLPLLIWGPDYCSAVRWARQHSPVAEVVTSQASEEIDSALTRLGGAEHRERLGRAAKCVGEQLFSYGACVEAFHRALRPEIQSAAAAHAI